MPYCDVVCRTHAKQVLGDCAIPPRMNPKTTLHLNLFLKRRSFTFSEGPRNQVPHTTSLHSHCLTILDALLTPFVPFFLSVGCSCSITVASLFHIYVYIHYNVAQRPIRIARPLYEHVSVEIRHADDPEIFVAGDDSGSYVTLRVQRTQ